MALQSALTNDQLTAIRSGIYQTIQFVCTVPNEIVVQFQPSVAPSPDVFAEIVVGTVGTGSMSNIREGMLVIFSTGTDVRATEFYRSRVRKVSGTSTLFVAENSTTLTTSHYVTVINTYEIQEKLRRDTTRVDWDITFRKLRPIETALQSAYVLTNDVTAFTPTASPIVSDADATSIITHAWESSNSNDVLNSGGTTASPDFTLEAGSFRWLRYTFTDNLGLSNYRVIPVWTVPKNYSNAVQLGFGSEQGDLSTVSFDAELGWTCTVPAFAGITTLLNRTFTVLACDEWYGGVTNEDRQSIRTNINFVGYLQNESVQTNADENAGRISEATFTIESFGHQLARQNISPVTIIQKRTSAAAWDEIKNPTPGRMLTYRLTEYSTASNLIAIALPDDDEDFIGDDLALSTEKALDDLVFIAEGYNAEIQFDITGKLEMCRDLNYLDSDARNAAPVVATLTPDDFVGGYTIDYEYGWTTSQATLTGGDFTTASGRYDLTEAIAPAEARYTEGDPFELSNQVLKTNSTQAEANAELAQRAANHLAAQNPTWTLSGQLKDPFHFLITDVGAWVKFDIDETDTVRGKAFGSNDRWQLVQIDVSTNLEEGTREVNFTARHETSSTGASVRVSPSLHDANADIDYVPAVLPPLTGGDLSLTDGTWYDSQSPQPPSDETPVDPDCEATGFRAPGYFHETTKTATNNQWVSIKARGAGRVGNDASGDNDWCQYIDFTTGTHGWDTHEQLGGRISGTHTPGVGWLPTDTLSGGYAGRGMGIEYTYTGNAFIREFTIYYDYTFGHVEDTGGTPKLLQMAQSSNGALFYDLTRSQMVAQSFDGTDKEYYQEHPSSVWTVQDGIRFLLYSSIDNFDPNGLTYSGSLVVRAFEFKGTGDNPFADGDGIDCGEEIFGDAFYYWRGTLDTPSDAPTPYPDGFGLLVEGFSPLSIPPYNPSHEYALDPMQVNSGPVDFTYEPLFGTSGLTNWSINLTVCFLEGEP